MQQVDTLPIVSVIIPIYNVDAYLDTCVKSICSQTLKDIEVILVDDGSTDNCPAMCDAYARCDSRIKVIHKQNAGLGYARNSGLEIASGRYVAFIDSDDYIALNTLEVCVDIAERTAVDQVRFLFEIFSNDTPVNQHELPVDRKEFVISSFPGKTMPILADISNIDGYGMMDVLSTASACMCIYRRDAIVRSGIRFHSERELISEDYAFNIEFAAKSGAIAYTSYPFYFYRVNLKSLSKMYKSDRIERSVLFSQYLRTKLHELGYPDADLVAVGNMVGNLRMHLRHIYASDFTAAEKRRLHTLAVNHPYIKQIAASGEYRHLSLLQRVAFVCRNSYLISRMLTSWRDWMKSRLKK